MRKITKVFKVALIVLALYIFGPMIVGTLWEIVGGPIKAALLVVTPLVTTLWLMPVTRPVVERVAMRLGRKVLRRGTRIVKKGVRRAVR